MKCDKCGSERVLSVGAKCSDQFSARSGSDEEYDGYVPAGIGLGSDEDYVEFDYCLECGQLQGTWPKPNLKFE